MFLRYWDDDSVTDLLREGDEARESYDYEAARQHYDAALVGSREDAWVNLQVLWHSLPGKTAERKTSWHRAGPAPNTGVSAVWRSVGALDGAVKWNGSFSVSARDREALVSLLQRAVDDCIAAANQEAR